MFQDYCLSHGRPCAPGSIYCCEECQLEDYQACQLSSESEQREYNYDYEFDFEDEPATPRWDVLLRSSVVSVTLPFLYECAICKNTHAPSLPCKESSYTYTGNAGPIVREEMATSLEDNHELILSNYRKWLVNLGPQ